MSEPTISYFIPLTKADETTREVWGFAAVEQPDVQREILDYELSKPNFLAWSERISRATGGKSKGNVRALHKGALAAVGKLIHFEPVDDKKAFWVGAKIVDDEAWNKVVEGVFTGFSVGGGYGKRFPDSLMKGYTRYEALPRELSLVDVPAAPDARFELIKSGGEVEQREFANLAKGESLDEQVNKVRAAFDEKFNQVTESGDQSAPAWVIDVQTDQVIVDQGADGLFAYPYSVDADGSVAFGLPSAVEKQYVLKKSAGNEALSALIEEMQSSESEELKAFAAKLKGAISSEGDEETPPAEQGEAPASEEPRESDLPSQDNDPKEDDTPAEQPASEGGMPQGQGLSEDGVKQIVIGLLMELGLVQKQGDLAKRADFSADLRSTLDGMGERLSEIDDLKKSHDEFGDKQFKLISDMAKIADAADSLVGRVETLEKRGSMGPVLRELGPVTMPALAEKQQIELLSKMADQAADPKLRQLYQNEIARLNIKAAQNNPIS